MERVTIPGVKFSAKLCPDGKVADRQRQAARGLTIILGPRVLEILQAARRIEVGLVKIGGPRMDQDSLEMAMSLIREGIAAWAKRAVEDPVWDWLPVRDEEGENGVRLELEVVE